MIVLDAYPRPSECLAIRLLPNGTPRVDGLEPQRNLTAAGVIPSTYTEDVVKISFQAEASNPEDNLALRAMHLNPVRECAIVFAHHQFTEPVYPTRQPAPELPSSWGLSVSYYPIIYGIITLSEINPIRGCQRSVWDVTVIETRKITPRVLAWDGLSPFFNAEFCTAETTASDGIFTHTLGEPPPVNPLRTWSRTVAKYENQVLADTGVIWTSA